MDEKNTALKVFSDTVPNSPRYQIPFRVLKKVTKFTSPVTVGIGLVKKEDYVSFISANKKNYYSYQLKSAKSQIVVIKRVEATVGSFDRKEALGEKGLEIMAVVNISNRNKVPEPIFVFIAKHSSTQEKRNAFTLGFKISFIPKNHGGRTTEAKWSCTMLKLSGIKSHEILL